MNRARVAGIRKARAPLVVLLEDHSFPAEGWAEALIRAHAGPWSAVGPAVGLANLHCMKAWANYLIQYSPWMKPAQSGVIDDLPGHNSSYKKELLLGYGDDLESMMSRSSTTLAAAGLTTSQFGVLEALYHLGPLCQKDLARKILKSTGNMTLVIDNLEKRSLVERVQDDQDRRYFKIHLTPQGKDLISMVFPRHAAIAESVFAALDKVEQDQLGRLLKKLGRFEPNTR